MLRQRLGRNHAEDIEGTVCPYTRGQIKQKEINVLEETMESPQRGFQGLRRKDKVCKKSGIKILGKAIIWETSILLLVINSII